MGFNFPDVPTVGQKYQPVAGLPTYTWDGEKWLAAGSFNAAPVAPFDAMAYNGMQINGSMEISQENGITSRTTSGFVCDGWLFFRAGTMVLNVGQTPTAILPGISSQLYLSVATPQASLAANDQVVIYQNIEGYRITRLAWGTPNAQPITIGFWSQCSKPGVYSVVVCNSPVAYTYATTYTHAVANVSQYNVITIPGPTVGTWKTDNTAGLVILFAMAAGSAVMAPSANAWITGTYNAAPGQVNGVAGVDVLRITGVVVLPGTQAPTAAQSPLIMRPYDQELQVCKRYYFKEVYPLNYMLATMQAYSVNHCNGLLVKFPVEMRASPILGSSTGTLFTLQTASGGGGTLATGSYAITQFGCSVDLTSTTSAFVAGNAVSVYANTAGAFFSFDARL